MKEFVMKKQEVADMSAELQALQRQRAWVIKSRIMIANRLQASVAGTMGYSSGLKESERLKLYSEATKVIKGVIEGDEHEIRSLIMTTCLAVDGFDAQQAIYEKEMLTVAKRMPVAKWVAEPEQAGFGIMSLAVIIGETGDLNNYANPAKVWRRLGCAPYTKDDVTLMGSSWRSRGGKKTVTKLTAEDWTDFGYSPRRRSIAYVIGENIIKQNGEGPYRTRWLQAKIRAYETHPEWEWKPCDKCKGKNPAKKKCMTCGGIGEKCGHAHRHGMLLATKLLLKNLWLEWTHTPFKPYKA
jgi:hypothetical protein